MDYENQALIDELFIQYQNKTLKQPLWEAFFQGMSFQEQRFSLKDLYQREAYKLHNFMPLESLKVNNSLPHDESLYNKYAGPLAYEIFHLDQEEKDFFHSFEALPKEGLEKQYFFASFFEEHLHQKYPGQKRFSLEGLEGLIPLLQELCLLTYEKNIVLGMSHRGRLNVLYNLFNKPLEEIYSEFEQSNILPVGGDVKYHQGYFTKFKDKDCYLLPNPSHLEAIFPVSLGFAKALKNAFPIIIHGDSAFSGQGVVYESLQFSQLKGFSLGGSCHIVLDNLLGFTTESHEYKSTEHCASIAKAFKIPILHIKHDDPNSVVKASQLAIEYRRIFKKDIVLRLVGFRKHGHNESDEPRFTQYKLYEELKNKESFSKKYFSEEWKHQFFQKKEKFFIKTQDPYTLKIFDEHAYKKMGQKIFSISSNFLKLQKIYDERLKVLEMNQIDWAMSEALLYSSLLIQDVPVRLVGQDSIRGTFSHRLFQVDEKIIIPNLEIYNTTLSEYAALSFEYGYSLVSKGLTIWEAQFGDFINGAQVLIDQFLVSAEIKWKQTSSLVLFLPHGQEGQGPEHSSARIERFLQLCAYNNIRIFNPTNPAQLFHILRNQVIQEFKPAVILTPKSFLRHPLCRSSLKDLTKNFKPLLFEEKETVRKIIFCSGKIFYDLIEEVPSDILIVRIEQLYPLPVKEIIALLKTYKKISATFIQEEPANMGFMQYLKSCDLPFDYLARPSSSSPSTGFSKFYEKEQKELIKKVLL